MSCCRNSGAIGFPSVISRRVSRRSRSARGDAGRAGWKLWRCGTLAFNAIHWIHRMPYTVHLLFRWRTKSRSGMDAFPTKVLCYCSITCSREGHASTRNASCPVAEQQMHRTFETDTPTHARCSSARLFQKLSTLHFARHAGLTCTGSCFRRLLVASASPRFDLGNRGSSFPAAPVQVASIERKTSRTWSFSSCLIGHMSCFSGPSLQVPILRAVDQNCPVSHALPRPEGLHSLVPVRSSKPWLVTYCVVFSAVGVEALKRRRCSICVLGGSISLQARGSAPLPFFVRACSRVCFAFLSRVGASWLFRLRFTGARHHVPFQSATTPRMSTRNLIFRTAVSVICVFISWLHFSIFT